MNQDEVIQRFVTKYNNSQEHSYQITSWPDKEISKSNEREIDAISEAEDVRQLAIEHTSIDTFANQRLDSARFMVVLGRLETELKSSFTSHILLIVPTFAIKPGIDWKALKETLREWLIASVEDLPAGQSHHEIDGVPFAITIQKSADMPGWFGVARRVPAGLEQDEQLVKNIARALEDKNDQLRKYRESGAETVLILESQDITLVSQASLYKAFLQAHGQTQTPNIDQIWIASTHDPEDMCELNCYIGPEDVMENANPKNLMLGPRHAEYWADAIRQDYKRS